MKLLCCIFVALFSVQPSFGENCKQFTLSDREIQMRIVHWAGYERVGIHEYRQLLSQCDYDTNRLCGIARRVYADSPKQRVRSQALALFWMFGSSGDIPFLETCVTDSDCGEYAIRILRKVEGVCSNSIDQVLRFHALKNSVDDKRLAIDKGLSLESLSEAISQSTVDRKVCDYFIRSIPMCVTNNPSCALSADSILIRMDPKSVTGRGRVEMLRYAKSVESKEHILKEISDRLLFIEKRLRDQDE